MLLSAVLPPATILICFFLSAFGLALVGAVLFLILLLLYPGLPKAELIAGGRVEVAPMKKKSWLEFLHTCAAAAIPAWFVLQPEAITFWARLVNEHAMLNWHLVPAVLVLCVSSAVIGLRKATAITDQDIYSWYSEMETLQAEQKAKSGT